MSNYGRIRRSRAKISRQWATIHRGRREHKIGVDLVTYRTSAGYTARICLRGGGSATRGRGRQHGQCGVSDARSIQSAVAKAMKRLSSKIATRGRKYY